MRCSGFIVVLLGSLLSAAAVPPGVEHDRVRWEGTMRNIAVYRPDTAPSGAPLLLALGDAGRSASYALDGWRELAGREGFVVASVSSDKPDLWQTPQDGTGLMRTVVRRVQSRHGIDPRRVYLFGAGSGATFVLFLGLTQPEYFAAVGAFGGEPQPQQLSVPQPLARAVPVRIFYSRRMLQFDVEALEAAAQALRQAGADATVERLDVGLDFERQGRKAASRIWQALSEHRLGEEPRYLPSPFDR